MGQLIGIATRLKTKAPMDEHQDATVLFKTGVGSDSRGKKQNHRQVTVLTKEGWVEACTAINTDLNWTTRRANFLVEGLDLKNTTDDVLKIGTCELLITGELNPCYRMDAQHEGLTEALIPNWRGGVTCKILSEGEVKIGDKVTLIKTA